MKYHKSLSSKDWQKRSLVDQMGSIGMEIERAITWRKRENKEYSKLAFFRGLELLDLTMADRKNKNSLKELARLREVLVDCFMFDNIYNSSDEGWNKYFYPFLYAARKDR